MRSERQFERKVVNIAADLSQQVREAAAKHRVTEGAIIEAAAKMLAALTFEEQKAVLGDLRDNRRRKSASDDSQLTLEADAATAA